VLLGWFAPERPIVGVLPFDVPGSDAGDHVLAEGLAIDLRRRLAQFHSLTVRPARVRRGTPTDLQALGRQLGANHVLIGSVIGETGSMFAKGDQGAVNPGTTAFLREGDLLDSATYYRHDLAWLANPAIPKNPHLFVGQPTSPDATVRAISLGAQEQLAVFFESYGQTIIHPMPAQFFETPIAGAMPETLAFIR
jgi:hypothetical protein